MSGIQGATMYWGHGLGFLAGLIWLAIVIYLLTLAARLVRAIEKIANKVESRSP
jgi:Flp pilus assembly pilin Flp